MLTKGAIETALTDAMRSKDAVRKRTLRQLLAAIQLGEVERLGAIDEPGMLALILKEVKTRHEVIADAERAKRPQLVEAANEELAVLQAFLPQPFTPQELEQLALQAISQTGAVGPRDMGMVMKALLTQVQGRADGKRVSDVVLRLLTSR